VRCRSSASVSARSCSGVRSARAPTSSPSATGASTSRCCAAGRVSSRSRVTTMASPSTRPRSATRLDEHRYVSARHGEVEVSHVNLNDDVCEGLVALDVPAFSVQYHPEAAPGPVGRVLPLRSFRGADGGRAQRRASLGGRTRGSPRRPPHRRVPLMPPRHDLSSVLVLGSGPIVIGQAGEFDYSGTQACRVLREEGLRVILVNSNPATIMTDPDVADATYVEPLTVESVSAVIERERPDALLATLGGQTALNLAIDLAKAGVLERYDVELLGANIEAIETAEDREKFRLAMAEVGLETPRSAYVDSVEGARRRGRARLSARAPSRRSRSGAREGASPTTRPSCGSRSLAVSPTRRWGRSSSRSRCSAGRSSSSRSCATATTTASSSARSRTSMRWGCTRVTPSPSRLR
jgi:hypothetical protein